MKTKDKTQLQAKSVEELRQQAATLKKELTLVKLKAKSGKAKGGSTSRLADNLARVLTYLRQKELGI